MKEQPKLFVIQLGAIVSLYVVIISLLVLTFNIINLLLPDAIESYWEVRNAGMSARGAIAFLIVATPTYYYLMQLVNKSRREDPNHQYVPITRWLIHLSLFVGTAVLLGFAVGVIMQFLNGELTMRFILKTLATGLIVGGTMTYYMYDIKGYWLKHQAELRRINWLAAGGVVALILFSFTLIESPTTVREITIDEQQVNDLRDVEWRIEEVLRNSGELPESIEDLYADGYIPEAPDNREDYEFTFTDTSYTLCATFAYEDPKTAIPTRPVPVKTELASGTKYTIKDFDTWQHAGGRHCFERTVEFTAANTDAEEE